MCKEESKMPLYQDDIINFILRLYALCMFMMFLLSISQQMNEDSHLTYLAKVLIDIILSFLSWQIKFFICIDFIY